jgi:serine/threonine protein kinase
MWALGCVMFQMLEGKPPFKGASEYLTFQKVMSRDFTMPQEFPPAAKDLIGKLLVSTRSCVMQECSQGYVFQSNTFRKESLLN